MSPLSGCALLVLLHPDRGLIFGMRADKEMAAAAAAAAAASSGVRQPGNFLGTCRVSEMFVLHQRMPRVEGHMSAIKSMHSNKALRKRRS